MADLLLQVGISWADNNWLIVYYYIYIPWLILMTIPLDSKARNTLRVEAVLET